MGHLMIAELRMGLFGWQAGGDGRELGSDILGGGARCALMVLLWRLHHLRQQSQDGSSNNEEPLEAACQKLAQLRSSFVALLEATLQSTHEVGDSSMSLQTSAGPTPSIWRHSRICCLPTCRPHSHCYFM